MHVAIADDDSIVCSSLSTILEATGTADVAWTANTGTDAGNGWIASVGGDS